MKSEKLQEFLIQRTDLTELALSFLDKPVIKVITGMRRCGKSAMLRLIRKELLARGIPEQRILYLNMESLSLSAFANARSLYEHITQFSQKCNEHFYLMLDEIQYVDEWERALASCRVDFDCDIFVTGSNAMLLAGDLNTLLAGRFVTIPVYPLSFKEYLLFTEKTGESTGKDARSQFFDYLRYGALPGIHEMNINSSAVTPYLQDVFNSVLLKDVIHRNKIRDVDLLERIVSFIMDNMGNTFSAKRIADFLKSQGRKLSTETVYNYLTALSNAYLIRKASRYDIKGKRKLETFEKYFLEDVGLKHAVYGYRSDDISGLLENIVFLELKRRGYEVYIGKLDNNEIDFIAEQRGEKIYIQVCYFLTDKATIEREFTPLQNITDNYPKYVLSLDQTDSYNKDGILRMHMVDWLLDRAS